MKLIVARPGVGQENAKGDYKRGVWFGGNDRGNAALHPSSVFALLCVPLFRIESDRWVKYRADAIVCLSWHVQVQHMDDERKIMLCQVNKRIAQQN